MNTLRRKRKTTHLYCTCCFFFFFWRGSGVMFGSNNHTWTPSCDLLSLRTGWKNRREHQKLDTTQCFTSQNKNTTFIWQHLHHLKTGKKGFWRDSSHKIHSWITGVLKWHSGKVQEKTKQKQDTIKLVSKTTQISIMLVVGEKKTTKKNTCKNADWVNYPFKSSQASHRPFERLQLCTTGKQTTTKQ